MLEDTLNKVTAFASQAHAGQQRKFAPEPYIVHPIRVMELCRQYSNDISVLSAALLHDLLEDTPVTRDEMDVFLRTVMSEKDAAQTVQMVVELTDVFIKKNYPEWNRRKRRKMEAERLSKISAGGQTVKYADILDNSLDIVNVENDFAKKYLEECLEILHAMQKGSRPLYERALETVKDCMQKVKI
ncbi:MAG TPA: HD domain-containing protein [Chitinophagaceae bacterium]|nr:HD domain-containing protein [Chitinophagaceae bacterium]